MFTEAIEKAQAFTRPIRSILRHYGSTEVVPGAAALFFVNDSGWAITCKHVVQQLQLGEKTQTGYSKFKSELASLKGTKKERQLRRELEKKYGISDSTIVSMKNLFVGCVDGPLDLEALQHPSLDLALLHFKNFTRRNCTSFPVFPKDDSRIRPGAFICRLGFPFAEFTNFEYDAANDDIRWTTTGRQQSPFFPIEGMMTRFLLDVNGDRVGFEMSTPGLRGQSGGPAFDQDGLIWGVQSATAHLDLDFDVRQEVVRGGKRRKAEDFAFLHVGHCIHVREIKKFMREHGVLFQEA